MIWRHENGTKAASQESQSEDPQGLMSEAIAKGEVEIVRRLLTRRFGSLPQWVLHQLDQASRNQIEQWADRILDASSLESLFVEGEP